MEESNIARRVDLFRLIALLEEIYQEGADFVDLVILHEENQLAITTHPEYYDGFQAPQEIDPSQLPPV